jgi:hypothetical protein
MPSALFWSRGPQPPRPVLPGADLCRGCRHLWRAITASYGTPSPVMLPHPIGVALSCSSMKQRPGLEVAYPVACFKSEL